MIGLDAGHIYHAEARLIALLGLGIVTFASTNFDDLFVLITFFADRRVRAGGIALGQYCGIGVLVGVSLAASTVSLVLPAAYVGLLGLLPILIGLRKLVGLPHPNDQDDARPQQRRGGVFADIMAVAAVTIAAGGDNIGIYTPLFATQSAYEIAFTLALFAVLTGLWLSVAHWLVNHKMLGAAIRRYGHLASPFVLIGLGLWILHSAGAFALL
jgi:cadmium resistance protein CadD (predicted permease)